MAKIAFIGLGNMGGPMAANLVKGQHQVTAFDLSAAALGVAVEKGAKKAASAAEAVKGAEIVAKLKNHPGEWAQKQLAALLKLSPLSMAITLEQLKRCANRSFEDTMTIEYRMSQHCMRPDHDFFEGVRALLIDKDQKPKWNPPTIEGVTREMVEAHFKPVANDLFFD